MNRARDEPGPARPTDPFAALGGVQRRAIEQATAMFERLLRIVDDGPGDDPLSTTDGPEPDPSFSQLRASVARAVDLYLDLFQRTFESYVEMTESVLRRRGVSVAGAGDDHGADLVLRAVDGQTAVRGSFFVHNFSGQAAGPLMVRMTDLTSPDGSTIPSERVDVAPRRLDEVTDGSTSPIEVRIDVAGAPPGTYHGHAFAGAGALAVRLHIPEP